MKTLEELVNDVVDYEYEVRPYECNDCYTSKEEAYQNIFEVMSQNVFGILKEITEELDMYIKYEDLRDPIIKEQFNKGCILATEINEYYNYSKEKEKEI